MAKRAVILITGGSGGIGAALARLFARKGYSILINYCTSRERAAALCREINLQYGRDTAATARADVGRRGDVVRMFDRAISTFGQVDVLVNNAGINVDQPLLEMTEEAWRRVLGTILSGTFFCSQEYARRYQGDHGHIVNIGALTGIRGRKNGANYCSARAGVLTLTKCLALELAPRIQVNCVTPGYIGTEEVMRRYRLDDPENLNRAVGGIPLGRLGRPEDICRMVDFLVREASYITGQNFLVDGGMLMH